MTFNRRYYVIAILLSLCVLLESLCLSYVQQSGDVFYYSSSIFYVLFGIAIAILPVLPTEATTSLIKGLRQVSRFLPHLFGALFLCLLVYHISHLGRCFGKVPIDRSLADMLPTIQLACQRFLDGKTVYGPAPEIWPGAIMPYMPLMWMPFLPAAICGFDYRWVPLVLQFAGIFIALTPLFARNKKIPFIPSLIGCIALFLVLNYFVQQQITYWVMSEEGLVVGFYMLLSYALLRRNYWLIGLALTCCTLSRYSLLFWLPVYFVFVFFTIPRKEFIKLFLVYLMLMGALFIVPFFIWDPVYFIHIPETYTRLAGHLWEIMGINNHIYYNVGLFKFFTTDQTHTMFILELITSFVAPLIYLAAMYWLRKKVKLNERYIVWGSLKLSLVFFFGFIQNPFNYIFVPATLISYVVLFDYLAFNGQETDLGNRQGCVISE